MGVEEGDREGKSAEILNLQVSLTRKNRSGHGKEMNTSPHEIASS